MAWSSQTLISLLCLLLSYAIAYQICTMRFSEMTRAESLCVMLTFKGPDILKAKFFLVPRLGVKRSSKNMTSGIV